MYVPHYFHEDDLKRVEDFIRKNDFATLVAVDNNIPLASHLLVDLQTDSEGGWLVNGHMARANPLWHALAPEREALLIFGGPNTYISATWYNHVNVPTWNYVAVHLYGIPRVVDDPQGIRSILSRLIQRYEAGSDYRLEALPTDFVDKVIKGAIGFQVKVTRLEAAFKLSQNRDDEDYARIIHQLEQRGDGQSIAVANEMKKNKRYKDSSSGTI